MPKSMACGMSIESSEHRVTPLPPILPDEVHVDPGPEEIACWTAILRSDFEVTEVQLQSPFTDTSCIVTLEAPHDTNWYGPKSCSKMVGTSWDLNLQGIFQSQFRKKLWAPDQKISKIARATPVNQSSYCDVISKVMSSWSASLWTTSVTKLAFRVQHTVKWYVHFLYARWSKNNHSTKSKFGTPNV